MIAYVGMDLPRYLRLWWGRRRLIAAMAGAAATLALIASLTETSRYQASAQLLFGRPTKADAVLADGRTDPTPRPARAAATNLALASLDTVAARVTAQFPGRVTVEQLRDAVSIKAQGMSDVVTVTAQSSSPARAASLANAFATEIVAVRRETAQADVQRAVNALSATLASRPARRPTPDLHTVELQRRLSQLEVLKALETGNVRLVERATPPLGRNSPQPLRNVAVAVFVALIVGLVLVAALARFEDRIADEEELAAIMGVPVLSRIPEMGRSARPRNGRSPDRDAAFLEAFEFLRLNVELMGHPGDSVVIAVTSPAAAEGKTTVVSWLATSLALSEAEVVAVDLDVHKPELRRYFDASIQPAGVDDVLLDDMTAGLVEVAPAGGDTPVARSLERVGRDISESDVHAPLYAEIQETERTRGEVVAPHLRLLCGSDHLDLQFGAVAPGRLQALFARLRRDADYVLVDTVPVSIAADASAVAAAADGVILVVDMAEARRGDLVAAKRQLGIARASLLGIVLNRASTDFRAYGPREESRELVRSPAAT